MMIEWKTDYSNTDDFWYAVIGRAYHSSNVSNVVYELVGILYVHSRHFLLELELAVMIDG